MLKDNKRAYEHEQIMRDYDMVIKAEPGFCTLTLTVRICVAPSVISVPLSLITTRRSSGTLNLPRLTTTVG